MAHPQPVRFCPILVGRDDELATGTGCIASAIRGQGTLLILSGEAGAGKSRLLTALAEATGQRSFRHVGGICQEQDRDYPFAPFLDLLRQEMHGPRGAEFANLLGPERAVFARLMPELDTATESVMPLPPEHEKRRIFEAFVSLVARLAHDAPVLVTLEDLHWADEASLELLQLLPRRLAAARVLLLVTTRSDESAGDLDRWLTTLARHPAVTHHVLAPLTEADVAQMIAAMVETPVPSPVIHAIYERAEGNPLVVEELVHAIAHDLARERNTPTAWRSVTTRYVPASMTETIARRLDRLNPEIRTVAECAAVIGRQFSFATLGQVVEQDERALLRALRELIAAHLIMEEETEGTHLFAFQHALTRDAVYQRLLGPERQRLHRRVARALTTAAGNVIMPSESEIGYHYFIAEEWEAALLHCQRAGEQAQALYTAHAAEEHFSRALVAAERIGAPRMGLLLQRGEAYEWIGNPEQARQDYEAAEAAARAAGDRMAEWRALVRLSMLWGGDSHGHAVRYAEEALSRARAMGDPTATAHSLNRLGYFAIFDDRSPDALRYHQQALEIFRSLGDERGIAETLERLGYARYFAADLIGGTPHFREAVERYTNLNDRRGAVYCLVGLAQRSATLQTNWMVPETTRILDALAEGTQALHISRESGWRFGESYSLSFLAFCASAVGDYTRALHSAHDALSIAEEIENQVLQYMSHGVLTSLYLDLLALPVARHHVDRVFVAAERLNARHHMENAVAAMVQVCVAQGDFGRAEAVIADHVPADLLARTFSQRHFWLARSELALAQGDPTLALQIVDDLITSAPNIETLNGRGIPRLAKLRGEALTALGRYTEAEAILTVAAETARAQGARPLLWRIYLALGTLYRTVGRVAEAGEAFATVREIVEEIALTVPDARTRKTFARAATALIPGLYPLKAGQTAKRSPDGLTTRERAVITAVARGQSNREIADALFISEKTVEWHVGNCLRKRSFRTRAELAAWAVAAGLVPSPPMSRDATAP